MCRLALLPLLLVAGRAALAQTAADSLCWEPGRRIGVADFNPVHTPDMLRHNREHGVQGVATVAISSVLDVPRRKRDRGPLLEQAYFAPFWLRQRSEIFTADTAELARQQLYLEAAEGFCRLARRQLADAQSRLGAATYGVTYLFYATVAADCCRAYKAWCESYTVNVIARRNPASFAQYRRDVRQTLAANARFATTNADCRRLRTHRPVDERYVMSPTMGTSRSPCE